MLSDSGFVVCLITTAVPAKSESDVMFCLQIYQGLIIIRSLASDLSIQVECMQLNVLLNNCKQNITSLSLLVGTTVYAKNQDSS